MDSFGERLKHALETRKAERKALAAVLGISVQAISKIINTDSSMNAQNTAKAARYLQVSWFWLATGEGDMENVEYPVAKQEALALANLRTINTLDPSAAQRITGDLGRIADGLRAQEALSPRALPEPISTDGPTAAGLVTQDPAARKSA
jgi:transcriptional regulator with XRE-family HTH domain